MISSLKTFNRFDVILVPFPFTDRDTVKRRPALVISHHQFNSESGNSVLAMITSANASTWPSDVPLQNIKTAGLPGACVVRMKIFTLANELILKPIGTLSPADAQRVRKSLNVLILD